MNQVNIFIKELFHGILDDGTNDTLDKFLSEYSAFNHKNCPFHGDKLICSRKDTHDCYSQIWHQKYSLTFSKVIGF